MKSILFMCMALAITLKGTEPENNVQARRAKELSPFKSPKAMHDEFERRFIASPGFGMSRIIRPTFTAPAPALLHNGITYRVAPPDLIGLENDPTVYAARGDIHTTLMNTNERPREIFESRAMSSRETNAVRFLREGQTVVVSRIPNAKGAQMGMAPDLLVVGALRAGASCVSCHQCDKGQLLGAFTYLLKPMRQPAGTATNAAPVLSRL